MPAVESLEGAPLDVCCRSAQDCARPRAGPLGTSLSRLQQPGRSLPTRGPVRPRHRRSRPSDPTDSVPTEPLPPDATDLADMADEAHNDNDELVATAATVGVVRTRIARLECRRGPPPDKKFRLDLLSDDELD